MKRVQFYIVRMSRNVATRERRAYQIKAGAVPKLIGMHILVDRKAFLRRMLVSYCIL